MVLRPSVERVFIGLESKFCMAKNADNEQDKKFMRLAIKECARGISKGGGPFGAAITRKGKLVVVAHNTVVLSHDATEHAEINAIHAAGKKLRNYDLSNCTIYATTEPCPMCYSAIHWAKIPRIVYGASIEDAEAAGLNELHIHDALLKKLGHEKTEIVSGVLAKECAKQLRDWGANKKNVKY